MVALKSQENSRLSKAHYLKKKKSEKCSPNPKTFRPLKDRPGKDAGRAKQKYVRTALHKKDLTGTQRPKPASLQGARLQ